MTDGQRAHRRLAALGLFVLAPIGAEYLVGYDTSTGDPLELLVGLLFLAPLYGGAALIIRETAIRLRVGWRGVLCWAAAFGVVQAGLVDQSMFNPSYRDIPYWDQMVGPTWVPLLGLGVSSALSFVVGHVVWSIAAPIVLVESAAPRVRDRSWLRRVGLGVVAALYLAMSALICAEHLRTEDFVASPRQLAGTCVVVLALAVLGLWLGRRPVVRSEKRSPGPWTVGLLALVAAAVLDIDQSWIGAAVSLGVVVLAWLAVDRWSRRDGWSQRHVLLLAGGAMLARALFGFLVDPLGDGLELAKYLHNAGAVVLVVTLVAIGWRRSASEEVTDNRSTTPRVVTHE